MGIAIVDAMKKMKLNRARHEKLEARHAALCAQCEQESAEQERQRREVYDQVLVPFAGTFSRLKNVDLAELACMAMPGMGELPAIELTQIRLSAMGVAGAMFGGLGSGAGAGAAAYAAVGAFAAASTGTSISALSGAAATNATLAFLGGGSLAAGGGGIAAGTMVLGGLVTAPVLITGAAYVAWQGRRERRNQDAISIELDKAEAEFAVQEQRTRNVLERSCRVRAILAELQEVTSGRLAEFSALVGANRDYATYTPAQRSQVATLVGFVSAIVAVMAAPLVDDSGMVSDLVEQALVEAQARLDDLGRGGAT